MMNEFIKKNKSIFIVFIIVFLVSTLIAYLVLSDMGKGVDKVLTKNMMFCENKGGFYEYSYDCNKAGQCTKMYLNCDYLNAIASADIGNMGNFNYQKINQVYNDDFSEETMVNN